MENPLCNHIYFQKPNTFKNPATSKKMSFENVRKLTQTTQ